MNIGQIQATTKKLKAQRDEAREELAALKGSHAPTLALIASWRERVAHLEAALTQRTLDLEKITHQYNKQASELVQTGEVLAQTQAALETTTAKLEAAQLHATEMTGVNLLAEAQLDDLQAKYEDAASLRQRLAAKTDEIRKQQQKVVNALADREAARNVTAAVIKRAPIKFHNGNATLFGGDIAEILSTMNQDDPVLAEIGKRFADELLAYRAKLAELVQEQKATGT
jgi:chromosome segregation ATPase